MGLTVDEMREDKQSGRELAEDTMDVIDYVKNPSRAVLEMRQEREGDAFTSEEVRDYILNKAGEVEKENPSHNGDNVKGGVPIGGGSLTETIGYFMEGGYDDRHTEVKGPHPSASDQAGFLSKRLSEDDNIGSERFDGEEYFMDEEDRQQIYGD
jgi:hypothetical protein